MLVYLSLGSVPWQGLKPSEDKNRDILNMKTDTPIEEFCSAFPCAEALCEHLKYARDMEYEARPDYEYLKGIYEKTLVTYQVVNDGVWDWNHSGDIAVMAGDPAHWIPTGAKEGDGEVGEKDKAAGGCACAVM